MGAQANTAFPILLISTVLCHIRSKEGKHNPKAKHQNGSSGYRLVCPSLIPREEGEGGTRPVHKGTHRPSILVQHSPRNRKMGSPGW